MRRCGRISDPPSVQQYFPPGAVMTHLDASPVAMMGPGHAMAYAGDLSWSTPCQSPQLAPRRVTMHPDPPTRVFAGMAAAPNTQPSAVPVGWGPSPVDPWQSTPPALPPWHQHAPAQPQMAPPQAVQSPGEGSVTPHPRPVALKRPSLSSFAVSNHPPPSRAVR